MSQPAGTERPPPARGGGGGGNPLTRKYGGVPGYAWIAIVSLIAGGVIWYISRKRSGSAAVNTGATAQGPTQATCYDANGSQVACSDPSAVGSNATDYFEALYAQGLGINSQLENLGPQVTETGQDADAIQALLQNLPGSASTPPGTTPNVITGNVRRPPVSDLTVVPVSPTLARVSWRPPQFASHSPASTTYTIEIQGKDKAAHNIGSRTAYNVGGLKPGGHYTAVVTPVFTAGGPGSTGPSASRPFTMPARGAAPREISGGPMRSAA
ncbi:MAG TPA: fibronectin type III domain-containing protein [Streptosporangiaceae bacterium]|nr:fibronectin type III domain-containing protein [Streptosporangiaceae bacterium]